MRHSLYVIALSLLLQLVPLMAPGQYYFKHYQVDDGLLHNAVTSVIQDKNGMIWVGTRAGLNRFDGYSFKPCDNRKSPNDNIGNNIVNVVVEGIKGKLWVATAKGLFSYDPYQEISLRAEAVPAGYIHHLVKDTRERLWFITNGTLYSYLPDKNQLEEKKLYGACLANDGSSGLWIGRDDGTIGRFNFATGRVTNTTIIGAQVPQNLRSISKIYPVSESEILIGCFTQGLKIYNHKTGVCRSLPLEKNSRASIYVRDIIKGEGQQYWIATESGIYIYDLVSHRSQHLQKRLNDPYSLNDNPVYTFCKDKQGGMWVGSYFGGINYYSKENARFKKYYPQTGVNSISGNAVRKIVSDNKGHLWIGTEDAGVNRLDLATGQFRHYTATGKKTDIAYYNVHGLLALDNRLFIGMFYNGMDIMDTRTGRVTERFKLIKDSAEQVIDFVSCIYLTRDSTLLIGTAYHGASLLTYNPVAKTFKRVPQIPYNSYTWDIREDSKGNIWTGSVSRGAYYYHPVTGETGNIRFGDTINNAVVNEFAVYSICEDRRGFLWFATTGGGLIKVGADKKIIKKFNTQTGLPSNVLYSILEDDNGHLWISSLKGLICFNTITEKVKVYTQANGLLTDQFNYNSAYKHIDGSMYFGSVEGMISFDPVAFDKKELSPPTYITGFQINNRDVHPGEPGSPLSRSVFYTDTLVLNYDQNNFSIEFAALNYSSPQVTRYKYQLKGVDNSWTYLNTNRRAFFTDLGHGNYEFIVQAESNTGSWVGKERRLFIKILPPFWKSPLAYFFYILLLISAVYIATRLYRQNLEGKNLRKLQLFEHEKEKEIYQAKIEFFTHITHEIQTPLTLISGPIEWLLRQFGKHPEISKSLTIAEKNTRRLVSLTSQLLDFRKTEANQFSLNFVETDISSLIYDIAENFKEQAAANGVKLQVEAAAGPIMAFVDREAFIKIVTNLVSNAVKYAATTASVTADTAPELPGYFTIRCYNDGKGIPEEYREQIFEPFVRVKGTNRPGTGIGLSLAHSLTELHNGSLSLISGEPDKILFELRLPLRQEIEFQLGSWKKLK